MIYEYKFIDYTVIGIPTIEVYGENFHYQDLYELVGKNQYMTTFDLKNNTKSFENYGNSIVGVIYYDKKSLDNLEMYLNLSKEIIEDKICIKSPSSENISIEKNKMLKYQGIDIRDISKISFLVYSKEIEIYETGEKKVPNIIEIETDLSDIDVDILLQNYLIMKYNRGTKLIQYEKEQLIGITLAFNEGIIDSRILKEFGFSKNSIENNLNMLLSYYKVKENRNLLTETDKKHYLEIKDIIYLEKLTKFLKELAKAKITKYSDEINNSIFSEIFSAIETFDSSILMHSKRQIYWDVDSYIHILLRHMKDYQVGIFKDKTPFQYKEKDLKLLIEQVLTSIRKEIEHHFQNTNKIFTRHGKMAVFYNGDHYHLRINEEGKLIQFHMVDNQIHI